MLNIPWTYGWWMNEWGIYNIWFLFRDSNFSCKHDCNQYDLLYVVQTEYPFIKMFGTRTMPSVFLVFFQYWDISINFICVVFLCGCSCFISEAMSNSSRWEESLFGWQVQVTVHYYGGHQGRNLKHHIHS